MVATVSRHRRLLFPALILLLYALELTALYRLAPQAAGHLPIAWAPVVDLILLPLVLYGLFFGWQRLTRRSDWGPVLLVAAGVATVRFGLPPALRLPGYWLEAALASAELLVLLRALTGLRRVRSAFRRHRLAGTGFYESLPVALAEALPPAVARYVAWEVGVFATLVAWRRIRADESAGSAYSYVRRGAAGPIYVAVGLMAAVETVGVHILLTGWLAARWHPLIWVLTALSAYALVWLAADYLAMLARPHRIAAGHLHLRLGFRTAATVPLASVAAADPYRPPPPPVTPADRARQAQTRVPALAPAATECNICLAFCDPVTLSGPLGRARQVTRLAIAVDDVPGFLAELRAPSR